LGRTKRPGTTLVTPIAEPQEIESLQEQVDQLALEEGETFQKVSVLPSHDDVVIFEKWLQELSSLIQESENVRQQTRAQRIAFAILLGSSWSVTLVLLILVYGI
jgi:hypothetical protein